MKKFMRYLTSLLITTTIFYFSAIGHANSYEENPALLDIMPGNELYLNLNIPKSILQQSSTVIFRYGATHSGSTFNPYELGEYCEIYFHRDPSSWLSKDVSIKRTVQIKHVNEAWSHSPGFSMSNFAGNYRTGNNIWLKDDSIQRISCYFVQNESEPLSDKEIDEVASLSAGKDFNEIAFLVEEKLHYRLSLNHLKRHLGMGLVALNNRDLNDLDYWDQQSRKSIAYIRKELKAKGRKQFMKEMNELEKLATAVSKLMKIEGNYRRANGIRYDQPLDDNQNYQKHLMEEIKKQKLPEDIIEVINNKFKGQR